MSGRILVISGAGVAVVAAIGLLVLVVGRTAPPEPVADAPAATATPPAGAEPVPEPEPAAPRRPAAAPGEPAPPVPVAPTTGTLRIVSDVPDTSVFIDRRFLGAAPVMAADLAPGTYTLLLSATGYEAISETVEVAPGEREISVSFREIRLEASVVVVHKHRLGSCRGTLSATPKGLVYTTDTRDHAFSVSLTGVETFEVDYLQNNLRVKIRGGQTFNFEDPDADRDRLFVFHRDVDKARQRLMAGGR
ncbi:MAG TPA: PEGA domain-containing protein [Vicinamibacterales bacterium]|nr:PEGA domain-containing protein [Vicinamibacterales bacterium]